VPRFVIAVGERRDDVRQLLEAHLALARTVALSPPDVHALGIE